MLWSALVLLCQLRAQAGQSVTLSWDTSGNTNITGYKIYYGTACHSYSNSVAVGNTNTVNISGLKAGKTYYFAATSLTTAGIESVPSNEANYTVPSPATALSMPASANGQFSFTVTGTAGQSYIVQASTDLVNWASVQTNTAPFVFVDTSAASFSQRFYRTATLTP